MTVWALKASQGPPGHVTLGSLSLSLTKPKSKLTALQLKNQGVSWENTALILTYLRTKVGTEEHKK